MTFRLYGIAMALILGSCKVENNQSNINSGLPGDPTQWTCNELKTEYAAKRSELVGGIARLEATYKALEDAGRIAKKDPPADVSDTNQSPSNTSATTTAPADKNAVQPANTDAAPLGLTSERDDIEFNLADDGVSSKIGEGADTIPTLPSILAGMESTGESSNYDSKTVTQCDDQFEKFAQAKDTQILEQCRYVIELYNLVHMIRGEYNTGRKGECRSGKAGFQTGQVSTRFPFCQNVCRFGQTTCVKCTFTAAVPSHYICGEEQDTRAAIDTHCKEGGYKCSGVGAQCSAPQAYNDVATGTTNNRDSNTQVSVTVTVSARLEAEFNEGVTIGGHQETSMEVSIVGNLNLKNDQGAPLTSVNGGETATFYNCSIAVSGAVVRDVGATVGVGYDVVVSSGSATAGVGAVFNAMTTFSTTSRDIPAAGQPLVNMLEGCRRFALDWAKNDLPALITKNVVIKAVAARFMGETKDMFKRDTTDSKIFCETSVGGVTSNKKTYRITQLEAGLENGSITANVSYDGYYNGFDATNYGKITESSAGKANYTNLRKKIFEGLDTLSIAEIRSITWLVGGKGFTFTNCNKTDW